MVSTHAIPELAEGVRVSWEDNMQVFALLYPEGMLVLDRAVSEVLQHCDGSQTIEEILIGMKSTGSIPFDKELILADIDRIINSGLVRLR
jgi:coenzyme PQQ biosynthesis protein PqqD